MLAPSNECLEYRRRLRSHSPQPWYEVPVPEGEKYKYLQCHAQFRQDLADCRIAASERLVARILADTPCGMGDPVEARHRAEAVYMDRRYHDQVVGMVYGTMAVGRPIQFQTLWSDERNDWLVDLMWYVADGPTRCTPSRHRPVDWSSSAYAKLVHFEMRPVREWGCGWVNRMLVYRNTQPFDDDECIVPGMGFCCEAARACCEPLQPVYGIPKYQ